MDPSRTAVTTDSDVKTLWPRRVSCSHSFRRLCVSYNDKEQVDDGPAASDAPLALTIMSAFTENWGLMEKLARGLAEFEAAFIAARRPWWRVKIKIFLLPARIKKKEEKEKNGTKKEKTLFVYLFEWELRCFFFFWPVSLQSLISH